nr:MAG TPA: Kunitz trypsin inhibitor (STI) trypsin inhibitor, beta-trefoil.83A [Caudoviricetes sp.]
MQVAKGGSAMLENVLRHLNNWFLVEIHEGTYKIVAGS